MTLLRQTTSVVVAAVSLAGLAWMVQIYYWRRKHKGLGKKFGRELKETEFSINKNVYFCNNGSFAAVPRQVLEMQKRLMDERERNPELWYRRQFTPSYFTCEEGNLYQQAVADVAHFVGAKPKDLVLVENATSDCEAVVVQIPVPIKCEDDIVKLYAETINKNPEIKVAVIDHITSPSAIVMPIERLAAMCKTKGILVLIDGAHAPGQLALKLNELPVDFYVGNLHKWLFAPRGCALMWVHPSQSDTIRHVVTSHNSYAATLMERFCFVGTRDNIPYYVATTAIKFHTDLGGLDKITSYNSTLVKWAADMLCEAWKTQRLAIPTHMMAPFMMVVAVPKTDRYPACEASCNKILADVFFQSGVFAAFVYFNKQLWCRISAHVYNCREDYNRLRDAVLVAIKK